jgi:hypothetical protein
MLNTFEMKVLRRIYGPIHEGGRWRPRWNNELYTLYNELYTLHNELYTLHNELYTLYNELYTLYNELYTLYNDLNIVEDIKIRRLGWAGQIIRMEDPKKGVKWNLLNTRAVGRPRTRWADMVQRDALQLLGVRGWRRRASNRGEWRHALGKPRPGRGCSAIHGWTDV